MRIKRAGQLALEWPQQTSHRAEDFVVGACNIVAHDVLARWPDWPHFAVWLEGPVGAGKTHLAHLWATRVGAGITQAAVVLEHDPAMLVTRSARWVVEFEHGTEPMTLAQETALFHLHNLLQQADGSLLLVAPAPVARMAIAVPDLGSRLAACTSVSVGAPDDALLIAVMRKVAADRQIVLKDPVVTYVLRRIERSFAAVTTVVEALDRAALERGTSINVGVAAQVLAAYGGAPTVRGDGE